MVVTKQQHVGHLFLTYTYTFPDVGQSPQERPQGSFVSTLSCQAETQILRLSSLTTYWKQLQQR